MELLVDSSWQVEGLAGCHHKDTETQRGRSNRGTDIEIRLLISLSVPRIIPDCFGPSVSLW